MKPEEKFQMLLTEMEDKGIMPREKKQVPINPDFAIIAIALLVIASGLALSAIDRPSHAAYVVYDITTGEVYDEKILPNEVVYAEEKGTLNNVITAAATSEGHYESATAPTHNNPILNSTSGNNLTSDNLTVFNQSTYDAESDPVKNIIDWRKNSNSIMVLNIPFENSSGSFAVDYSGSGNNGIAGGNAAFTSTGGYDGKGAYDFDGKGGYINIGNDSSLNLADEIIISAWIKGTAPGFRYSSYTLGALSSQKHYPQMQVAGDKIYVAWCRAANAQSGVVNVAVFSTNGSLLHYFEKSEIDQNRNIKFHVAGGKAYFVYTRMSYSTFQKRLVTAEMDADDSTGSTWSSVEREGINTQTSDPKLQVVGNRIYYLWKESNSLYASVYTMGGGWTASSSIYSSASQIYPAEFQVVGNKIYFVWSQTNGSVYHIWTAEANASSSLTEISNSFSATQRTTTGNTKYNVKFAVAGGKMYFAWVEVNTSGRQFWTAEMNTDGTGWIAANRELFPTGTNINDITIQVEGDKIYYAWEYYDGNNDWEVWTAEMNIDGTGWKSWMVVDTTYDDDDPVFQVVGGKRYYVWEPNNDATAYYTAVGMEGSNILNKGGSFGLGVDVNNHSLAFVNSAFDERKFNAKAVNHTGALANASIDTNAWNHVAMSYNKSILKLYVNGELADSFAFEENISTNPFDLMIGDNFNGTIDEVKIYNYSLSSEQVKSLYENRTDLIVSQETAIGDTWQACITPNDGSADGTEKCSNTLTITTASPPPATTEYNTSYGSTDFSEVDDIENVTNMTLATDKGKIKFPESYGINASGEDYDTNVEIGAGFISVNTAALHPSFNSSANITINNITCPATIYYGSGTYTTAKEILTERKICSTLTDPSCTVISCTGGNLTFTVSHFTGFATAATANLTIWDETDTGMPYAGQTKYPNEKVKFYANYTNSSGTIQGADCVINFTDTSSGMAWNTTKKLYEYNRSFSSDGTFSWNATCNKTGYSTLTANDTVNITAAGNFAPILQTPILNSSLGSNSTAEDLTLWVNATDSDGDNITYWGEWYKNGTIFVGEHWVAEYDAKYNAYSRGIAFDSSGNVYVTGYKSNINGKYEYHTIKYDENGSLLWEKIHFGAYNDEANAIAVDSSGNVYVTGESYITSSDSQYYTIKYDTDGNQIWNKTYSGGTSYDEAYGIAVDINGNVSVTGTTRIGTNYNYFTIKYDTNGNQIWNKTYDGGSNFDIAYAIATDSEGNVYVTGGSQTIAPNYDYYTIKYDTNGNQIWNRTYGGTGHDRAYGIAVDNSGNVYVTGQFYIGSDAEYYTIKYNASGSFIWAKAFDINNYDVARAIAVDTKGNIYIAGDTSIGGNYNYYIIKYDTDGNQIWNKTYDSGTNYDYAYGIAVDSSGAVYVAARSNYNYRTVKYKDGFVKYNQEEGKLVQANILESQLTSPGDVWQACVIPSDGTANGAINCSNNLTTVDKTPPSITLVSPENRRIEAFSQDVEFIYYVSDSETGVENCSLVLNHIVNQTNSTIINNALNNFTANLPEGQYNWSINCTDNTSYSNEGYSGIFNLSVSLNIQPTQGLPILNSSSGSNETIENLTVNSQSTYDSDSNIVKDIINWFKGGTSITVLNMPFEASHDNEYYIAKDYSTYGNNATTNNTVWSRTGGYDSRGAYLFNGSNHIEIPDSSSLDITNEITIEAWVKGNGIGNRGKSLTLYDLTNTTNNWAYSLGGGGDTPIAPSNAGYVPYNHYYFSGANASDSSRNQYTQDFGWDNLLYEFKINEPQKEINSLKITWIGYDDYINTDFELDTWNLSSGSWHKWHSTTTNQYSDQTYTYEYTSGFSGIINSSTGIIYIAASGGYNECFLEGTLISLSNGSYRNIEDIRIGDIVMSYDEESKSISKSKVVKTFFHKKVESYLVINNKLKLTSNHPMYVNNEWKEAGEIKVGDLLLDNNGNYIPVASIEKINKAVPVYNLEVEEHHNYFAEDILTHNKCPRIFTHNGTEYQFDSLINAFQVGKENEKEFEYPLSHLIQPRMRIEYDPNEINYVDFIQLVIEDKAVNGRQDKTYILSPVSCTAEFECLSLLDDLDYDYLVLDEDHKEILLDFGSLPELEQGYERKISIRSSGYQIIINSFTFEDYPDYVQEWMLKYMEENPSVHHNTMYENYVKVEVNSTSKAGIIHKGREAYTLDINSSGGIVGHINNNNVSGEAGDGWNHVVMTYNGSVQRLYINSQLVDSQSLTGSINTNSEDVWIGYGINGTIDELKLYNISLSPEQITALYENKTNLIVSNETSIGDVWQACITPNDGFEDGSTNCSNSLTILEVAEPPQLNATEFNISYGSTDFSEVDDIENVTNMTLATKYGKIKFPESHGVNASGEDYDTNIEIGAGFISVNTTALHPSFNSSANITINNITCPATIYYGTGTYTTAQQILSENNICSTSTDPSCTIISCSNRNLTFTVSHFTGFATAATANLTIWDETDSGMPYAGQTKYPNEQVKFYANYTNSSGTIEGADCVINFTDTSSSMAWNATTELYEYNRSFSNNGTFAWNATCNKTGYDKLTANDTVNITPLVVCDVDITGCGTPAGGWQPGTAYCLTQNIASSETCLTVASSSVVINCQGFNITRTGATSSQYAIYVNSYNNITIRDCNTYDFRYGLYLRDSDDNLIENNRLEGRDLGIGFYLVRPANSTFIGNNVTNFTEGTRFDNSEDNIFRNNTFYNNTYNFNLVGTPKNNSFDTSNTVNGKILYYLVQEQDMVYNSTSNIGVFYCLECNNITVRDSNISNEKYGIYLFNTSNSFVINNSLIRDYSGAYLVHSNNNTFVYNTMLQNEVAGVYLEDGTNNNVSFNTGIFNDYAVEFTELHYSIFEGNNLSNNNDTTWGAGLECDWYCDNNTYKDNILNNNNAAGWDCGADCSNNIFINNTVKNNGWDGFACNTNCPNATLINNSVENNSATCSNCAGFACWWYCPNSTFTGNTFDNNNYYGIYFYDGSSSLFLNNTFDSNNDYGIYIEYSNFVDVINNSIKNNRDYGIFYDSVLNSTLSGNNVTNNSNFGLGMDYCDYNLIYNNYFNNINNTYDTNTLGNYWNTTYSCSAGSMQNIIGGDCIGGNYWSDYAGVDNTGDYIGDTNLPYNASNNITSGGDFLPLVYTTTAEFNPPNITLISPQNNTLNTTTSTITFTYNASDDTGIANCSIILNSVINKTNSTITNNQHNYFTIFLPNEDYIWSINCTDNSTLNNIGASKSYNLSVNFTNIPPDTPYVFINATDSRERTVDDLICWANTTDADADNVSYEGFWYRNGVQNISFTTWPNKYSPEDLTNVSTLDSGRTYSGEEWSCRARAYDSYDYSNYSSSENLTVQPLYPPAPSTSGGGGVSSRGIDECGSGQITCINGSSSAFCAYDLVENRWKWFEVKCGENQKCADGSCIPLECKEDWVCDDWELCINGIQERDCFEWGHCGTQEFKPAEQRECVAAKVPTIPAIEPPFQPPKPPTEEIPAVVTEQPELLPLWASLLITAAGLIIIISAAARIYISSRIGAVIPKLRNLKEMEHINNILQNMNSKIKEHTIKIKKFKKGGKNA